MPKIIQVEGMTNKTTHGLVSVILDDGTEAEVYVGGACEVFFHKGKIKAFVKKGKR